ncbi:MAG: hypothetical protein ACOYB7_15145 [Mycobacterium sp.]
MRAIYVGRVGALAVALGVGTAIFGVTAVAAADTGPDGAAGSAGQESTRSGDSGSATNRTRVGSRRGAATETAASPAPAAGRRSGPRSGTVAKGVPADNGGTPAVSLPQSPADLIGALLTPGGMTGLVQQAVTSLIGDLLAAVPADALVPEAALTPEITAAPSVDVAVAEPPVMMAQPDAMSVAAGDPLDLLGGGSGTDTPLATPLSWAAVAASRQDPAAATPEVAPAATVTTAAPDIPSPALPSCKTLGCTALNAYRGTVENKIAESMTALFPQTGPAGTCDKDGCSPYSVANLIAAYAYPVFYSLVGGLPDETVGSTVVALVQQPAVLTLISQTVAGNAALAALPSDVKTTIGNAVATFVVDSLGNPSVATQFAPVLKSLNLPTGAGSLDAFNNKISKDGLNPAILSSGSKLLKTYREFSATTMQTALVGFFTNAGVQTNLGSAFAGSINVLLGQATPTWEGAPQTSNTALADYLGQLGANTVLGPDNPNTQALTATIGGAVAGLFTSIGGVVANQASSAFTTLLQQPTVATSLANYATNGFWNYLNGPNSTAPLPFPAQPLLPALAPAAGVAVTGFVNSILSTPAVPVALGAFVNTLIPGMLANPGVQELLGEQAATAVTTLLGDDALAQAVGARVGPAVASLVATPSVSIALTALVNSLFGSILAAPGAVTALANAAGQLTTADLDGTLETVRPVVEAELRTNAAIDGAVQSAVTSGVAALFGNAEVVSEVNAATVSLVTGLLGDSQVQQALGARVTSEVAKLFGDTELGQAVGAQAGIAVVNLLSNPSISAGLVGLVDTVFGDFFGAPGVVTAFSTAAGELAAAGLAGNLDTVLPQVQAQLMANPAIQTAVRLSVGDAVTTLLTDPNVVSALDTTASSLVAGLLGDPAVEAGLNASVAAEVSTLLGGGPLGQAVGAQVGAAVAGLLSQQAVRDALAGLVDTELGDFFTAPGVVAAFSAAADAFALNLVTGEDFQTAVAAAVTALQASTAVENAVGSIVTNSVAELLNDTALWSAFDTAAVNLVSGLLANPAVQQAASTEISAAFGDTALGQAVGAQVASAVVDLMNNPNISAGLVGVVDTVFGDFFGTPGVVTAFSDAAGQLASAAVTGDLPTVLPQVQAELLANTAVQSGVNLAVGDAVTTLLTDPNVISALDLRLASLVSGLLGDPDVQTGLDTAVTKEVSALLGGGPLGQAVGAQVGTAVVEILSNPIVKDALEASLDNQLGDFFSAPGVVNAFATAADTFALGVVTGEKITTALSAAEAQLRSSAAIDNAVGAIVTASVADLLGNSNVWSAVDGTASRLVADLLASTEVQQAAYTEISTAFGNTALGQAVGDKVAAAVVDLMQDPDVSVALVGLVDTTTQDFFGYPGVVTAFADAAGELASAAVAGTLATVAPTVQAELRANAAVEQATGLAVGDAVTTLLTDDTVLAALDQKAASVVTELLTDPAVQTKLNALIVAEVSKLVGGGALGQAVGTQVATAVETFLSNPSVQVALVGLVDDELGNFFRAPGVVDAFAEAANTFALEVVTGEDVKTAANQAVAWLRADAAVDDAVVGIVTESVGALLSNANVIQAADSGLATLLTNLGPDAGQLVTVFVTKSLGASPIAVPVGQALGAAVQQLLTVPGFGAGVVTIITSALPEFLDQFGVPTALAGIAGDYLAALVAGDDPKVAEQNAVTALRTNPTIDSAAKTTVADSLTLVDLDLLSSPAIQQALGATVTTLITTLAADPAIQAFVAQQDGPALAELLTDTAAVADLATGLGSVVTQLLAYPGFNTALLGAVNQFADDVIDGAAVTVAEQSALNGLRSAPAVVAAVGAVIPPAVNTLLSYSDVRQALGVVAQEDIIAALQKVGINNRFLDRTIGQVTDGTVESLLVRPAGVNLVDDLVVNILLGMPLSDWRGFTIQEVIDKPQLQIALGMSLGKGIGSLFGDNVIGDLVGLAAGVPATLAIGLTSLTVALFQLIFGRPAYGVSPSAAAGQALPSESHYFQAAPAAADLYVIRIGGLIGA